jgi:urease accessory protein
MLRLTKVIGKSAKNATNAAPARWRAAGVLTLRFEDRRRSRMRARLDDGREAALLLPHGTILRDGDELGAEAGDASDASDAADEIVVVRAAAQTLSVVRSGDALVLARAAYHLGNRHVPVQLGAGWLAYEHDHVLDEMVEALGLTLETRIAPFEPEAGGYKHDGAAKRDGTGHHAGHHHSGHHHDH